MQPTKDKKIKKAVAKNKTSISAIWILPLIALLFASWMAWDKYQNRPIMIEITFDNAEGIIPGKTEVRFEGLTFGKVRNIQVNESLRSIIAHVEIDRKATYVLNENAKFWLVKPQFNVTGISGLDTIVSGNYIASQVSADGAPQRKFTALDEAPENIEHAGTIVRLLADELGSIHRGAPINYRELEIGSVSSYRLAKDGKQIQINALIKPEYNHLINEHSVFWNRSGIQFQASIANGVSIDIDSLASLIAGGIAMEHNDASQGSLLPDGKYRLFQHYQDANMYHAIDLILPSIEAVDATNTKIKYRGMELGKIVSTRYDRDSNQFIATAHIDPEFDYMLTEDSYFWLVKPNIKFNRLSGLETLFTGRYVSLQLGKSEVKAKQFTVNLTPPTTVFSQPGLLLNLIAHNAEGLDIGTPILYRKLPIGEVVNIVLDQDSSALSVQVQVEPDYQHLINAKTKFWKSPGIDITGNLANFELKVGSLLHVIEGGIEISHKVDAPDLAADARIRIFEDKLSAFIDDDKVVRVKLLADSINSLQVNSPVYYRHLQVGYIDKTQITDDKQHIILELYIKPKYANLLNSNSRFWKVSGINISGDVYGVKLTTESMMAIINGGIAFESETEGAPFESANALRLHESREEAFSDTFPIKLTLASSEGLRPESLIKFHGIHVGKIVSLAIHEDLNSVIATAEIDRNVRHLINEGTQFWQVKPLIGLVQFKHVDTVVKGPYITFRPGSGEIQDEFTLLRSEPPKKALPQGLNITLLTANRGSIKQGNPVYYRGVKVGEVTGIGLSTNAQSVEIYLNIYQNYSSLVTQASKFWNQSGVNVDFGLFSGAKVRSNSIEAILQGGVEFATPEEVTPMPATNGSTFTLHKQSEDEWLSWAPAISIQPQ